MTDFGRRIMVSHPLSNLLWILETSETWLKSLKCSFPPKNHIHVHSSIKDRVKKFSVSYTVPYGSDASCHDYSIMKRFRNKAIHIVLFEARNDYIHQWQIDRIRRVPYYKTESLWKSLITWIDMCENPKIKH